MKTIYAILLGVLTGLTVLGVFSFFYFKPDESINSLVNYVPKIESTGKNIIESKPTDTTKSEPSQSVKPTTSTKSAKINNQSFKVAPPVEVKEPEMPEFDTSINDSIPTKKVEYCTTPYNGGITWYKPETTCATYELPDLERE